MSEPLASFGLEESQEAHPKDARLGGYTILGKLGSGGMGEVLRARDPAGRDVAIKLLTRTHAISAQRFEREAQALARLRHPDIVQVHSAGVQDGQPYFVMEAVEGRVLQEVLDTEGPLPVERACALVADLADALAYAHDQGVLHRDLKPDNVLIRANGSPVVVDFGLAKLHELESLTQSGQILGTPNYMAPEQARGGSYDERTDVYGLGAVLFAALTARCPVEGSSLAELLAKIVDVGAPDPRSLLPTLPRAVSTLCARALALDPQDRYPNARSLRADLLVLAAGGTLAPARRRARLAPAAALLVCTLGGGVALALNLREPEAKTAKSSATPAQQPTTPRRALRYGARADSEWAESETLAARALGEAPRSAAAQLRESVRRGRAALASLNSASSAGLQATAERQARWERLLEERKARLADAIVGEIDLHLRDNQSSLDKGQQARRLRALISEAARLGGSRARPDRLFVFQVLLDLSSLPSAKEQAALLRDALTLQPDHPSLLWNHALFGANAGEFVGSLASLERLIASDKDQAFVRDELEPSPAFADLLARLKAKRAQGRAQTKEVAAAIDRFLAFYAGYKARRAKAHEER